MEWSQLLREPQIRLIRCAFPILAVLAVACTAPQPGLPPAAETKDNGDLEILLLRDAMDGRPSLVVSLTNRSPNPICISAEVLRNPDTLWMEIYPRDGRGRSLPYGDYDLRPPPLTGTVRVEPGASTQAHYYLDYRFRALAPNPPLPKDLTARAEFRYGYCDDDRSLQARSEWQRI
jgi:hypothetical protein